MKQNYETCLNLVLRHEGGYVNHRDDPGGATNRGVTQKTYNSWRKRMKLPRRSVKEITRQEIEAIYRRDYWDKVRGDELPGGVDYAVFDFGVNSGPSRAIRYLQSSLDIKIDGKFGPQTMQAVSNAYPPSLVGVLCDKRLAYLKRLKHWDTFGRGWSRRVADVRSTAGAMALVDETDKITDDNRHEEVPVMPLPPDIPVEIGGDLPPPVARRPDFLPPVWMWLIGASVALVAGYFIFT